MGGEVWWQTWQALLPLSLLIVVVVGLRPTTFWPILIIGNMVGNGPRLYQYFFLDEIVTGCVLIGAFMSMAVGHRTRLTTPSRHKLSSIHNVFFLVWVTYMVILSFVGIGTSDDPRVVRWVLFYGMIAGCWAMAIRDSRFQFPEPRRAMRLVLIGAIVAFGSFLIQGIYTENVLGTIWSRFDSQDYLWAGSAYATFPITLGMPAALFFLRDRSVFHKSLAWVALALFMTAGFYFLSRVTWLVLAAFIALNPERVGIRRGATLAASFLLLFLVAGPANTSDLPVFLSELVAPSLALTASPEDSDITRNLQVRAAFETVSENWLTAITGSGIYSNRYRIAPHIEYLQALNLEQRYALSNKINRDAAPSDSERGRPVYRTTGFPALLIDTGVIGLLLLIANFVLAGITVIRGQSPDKRLLLLTLPIVFLWLLVSNTADVILQYLLIMPGGLLVRLGESPWGRVPGDRQLAPQAQPIIGRLGLNSRLPPAGRLAGGNDQTSRPPDRSQIRLPDRSRPIEPVPVRRQSAFRPRSTRTVQ